MMWSLLAALALGPSEASAPAPREPAPIGVQVAWDAPAQCPNAAMFLAKISEFSGRQLRFEANASVAIEGRIRQGSDGQFSLALTTEIDAQREVRDLRAGTCSAVVDASAVVVALAIEPFAVADETAAQEAPAASVAEAPRMPEPAPSPSPAAEAVPARTEARPRMPAEANVAGHEAPRGPRRRHGVLIFAEGAGAAALTTSLAGGVAGGLGWYYGRAQLDLAARHWFRSSTPEDPGVRLGLTSAAVRGCFVPSWGRLALPVCGGAEAGRLTADGVGTGLSSTRSDATWLALLAGLDATFAATPRLAPYVRMELAVVPSRPAFHVRESEGDRTVYITPPVSARLAVGLRFNFLLTQ